MDVDSDDENVQQTEVIPKKTFSVEKPEKYYRDRDKTRAFLFQVQLYWKLHGDAFVKEVDKIVWASSFCKGKADYWIQPHIEDFLEKGLTSELEESTLEILTEEGFGKAIQKMFGEIDPRHVAEKKIQRIRQVGTVEEYTSSFLPLQMRCGWDDEAYAARYYNGLKDDIKDEICRQGDKPIVLDDIVEKALKISQRFEQRRSEKQGGSRNHFVPRKFQKAKTFVRETKDTRTYDPMHLDATQRDDGNRSPPNETRTCYNCGKVGHLQNVCQQAKKPVQKTGRKGMKKSSPPRKPFSRREFAATQPQAGPGRNATTETVGVTPDWSYCEKPWTQCFDNDCLDHQTDKEQSGWWPKEPTRSRSACVMDRTPVKQPANCNAEDWSSCYDEACWEYVEEGQLHGWWLLPTEADIELDNAIAEARRRYSATICQDPKFCGTKKGKSKSDRVVMVADSDDEDAVVVDTRKGRQESRQNPKMYARNRDDSGSRGDSRERRFAEAEIEAEQYEVPETPSPDNTREIVMDVNFHHIYLQTYSKAFRIVENRYREDVAQRLIQQAKNEVFEACNWDIWIHMQPVVREYIPEDVQYLNNGGYLTKNGMYRR